MERPKKRVEDDKTPCVEARDLFQEHREDPGSFPKGGPRKKPPESPDGLACQRCSAYLPDVTPEVTPPGRRVLEKVPEAIGRLPGVNRHDASLAADTLQEALGSDMRAGGEKEH